MDAVFSPPHTEWTILSLVDWSARRLTQRGFPEARLHVELLLAHALNLSRLQLYTSFDRPLNPEELSRFKALFTRRCGHEPVQYILGETEFMGLPILVDHRVLIPRPETEQLVEKALEMISKVNKQTVEVFDIGTGSGNIAIAIAKLGGNVSVTAIDASTDALDLAKQNAERNSVNTIRFVHADAFSESFGPRQFDFIVSNPPYVSLHEYQLLPPEIRDFEPRRATTDEGDGYTCIRRIAHIASDSLNLGGHLLMEIAYNQAPHAEQILRDAELCGVCVFDDFAGIPRILTARKA